MPKNPSLEDLISWSKEVGIEVSVEQAQKLDSYVEELLRWNEKFNLTALKEKREIYLKHIVDSLTMVPHVKEVGSVLDVGTGAGLPGIILAIMCPKVRFVLLDGQQKRIHFVQHVATALQLDKVSAVHSRIERYKCQEGFDVITSRAFSQLNNFCDLANHLRKERGIFIAMKGVFSQEERDLLPEGLDIIKVNRLNLPESQGERCLVFIK